MRIVATGVVRNFVSEPVAPRSSIIESPLFRVAHDSSGPLASKIAAPSVSAAWLYSIDDHIGGTAQRLPLPIGDLDRPDRDALLPTQPDMRPG